MVVGEDQGNDGQAGLGPPGRQHLPGGSGAFQAVNHHGPFRALQHHHICQPETGGDGYLGNGPPDLGGSGRICRGDDRRDRSAAGEQEEHRRFYPAPSRRVTTRSSNGTRPAASSAAEP